MKDGGTYEVNVEDSKKGIAKSTSNESIFIKQFCKQ